jgi:uncharacterized protein (DUF58 family)
MQISASTSTPERILRRLEWQVIRRLDGILQGDYRTLFYGFGLDLADLREYQPGDDVRYIDWNVTARMATPYIRQYTEDREITAWFVLDLSPSVDFGTVASLKRDCLIEFAAVIARLLIRHGNRVGVILYNGQSERVVPAGAGRLHVLRIIDELLDEPRLASAPFTDLTGVMATAFRIIKRRSLIFVVSDFISAPGWEGVLGLLSRRHEVLAVRLWDPREVELPDIGLVWMGDSETGEQLLVDTHDKGFRKRFHEAALRRRAGLDAAFRHARVDVLSLSTEDDLVEAIVQFIARRKRQKQIAHLT